MDDTLHSLDNMRGHSLVPPDDELVFMPKLYETDTLPFADKLIRLRFFTTGGSGEWLIVEADPEDSWLMFGFADLGLGPGMAEWGYISLHELATLRVRSPQGFPIYVERDLHWTPTTFGAYRPSEG